MDGHSDYKRHNCKQPRHAPITGGFPRFSSTPRDPRVVTISFLSPPFFFFLSFLCSCECFAATHVAHRYAFHSLDCSNKAFKVIAGCGFTLISPNGRALPLQVLRQKEFLRSMDAVMWQEAVLAIAAMRYLPQTVAEPGPPHGAGLMAPGISCPGRTLAALSSGLCSPSRLAHWWAIRDGGGCSGAPRCLLASLTKGEAGEGKVFRLHWPGLPSVPGSAAQGREEMPPHIPSPPHMGTTLGTASPNGCGHLPRCGSPGIQPAPSLLAAKRGKVCWTSTSAPASAASSVLLQHRTWTANALHLMLR